MSALWLLLVLGVWGGLSWLFWKTGRKFIKADVAHRRIRIGLAAALVTLWLGVSFWYGGGRKVYYDAEVNRLCAKDGGVKVYETVRLPAEKFNQWGEPNFYNPVLKANALGPEYEFKLTSEYVKRGPPSLMRFETSIARRQDNKLLGKSIEYKRAGGDIPGPWQPTTHLCPSDAGEVRLLKNIFVRSNP